jgi:hypothetical protein
LAAVLFSGAVRAQDASDGWKSMFDGKTLTGWKASEKPENWTVEEGCIVGRGDRSHLFYIDRKMSQSPTVLG